MGGHVIIQPGHVDAEVGWSIGLDLHQSLGQQVDGALSIVTMQAEVKTGREADKAFVKGFLLPFRFLPQNLKHFVALEVFPTVKP